MNWLWHDKELNADLLCGTEPTVQEESIFIGLFVCLDPSWLALSRRNIQNMQDNDGKSCCIFTPETPASARQTRNTRRWPNQEMEERLQLHGLNASWGTLGKANVTVLPGCIQNQHNWEMANKTSSNQNRISSECLHTVLSCFFLFIWFLKRAVWFRLAYSICLCYESTDLQEFSQQNGILHISRSTLGL